MVERVIEPFLVGGQASTGGSLLPSGRCPGGTSVLHGEPGRWVVWEGPGDLVFVLRKPRNGLSAGQDQSITFPGAVRRHTC